MKTFYIAEHSSGHVIFDDETKELSFLESQREAISRIWIAPEDMKMVYTNENGEKETLDVKKDQIIIRFYENDFSHRMIVVDSKEWVENITKYNKKLEERRNCNTLKNACGDALEEGDACDDISIFKPSSEAA